MKDHPPLRDALFKCMEAHSNAFCRMDDVAKGEYTADHIVRMYEFFSDTIHGRFQTNFLKNELLLTEMFSDDKVCVMKALCASINIELKTMPLATPSSDSDT